MRALQGYERTLGFEQTNNYIPALTTIENLSALFARRGKTSEAKVLYLRCQKGLKNVFGTDHERNERITKLLASQ